MSHQYAVRRALRAGRCVKDSAFDLVYPAPIQRVSNRFWTPVQSAATAAGWMKAAGCRSVLDVGAGAGKFCIVTSLALDRPITGLEHRPRLIEVARRAAAAYAAGAVFVHGALESVDPSSFDCFYMFNPFAENVFEAGERLDSEVELSERRWFSDLALVEHWLDRAKEGTLLVTYNGFGGRIPGNYRLVRKTLVDGNWLRAWLKRPTASGSAAFYIEVDDTVLSSASLEAVAQRFSPSVGSQRLQLMLDRPLGVPLR